MLVKEWVARDRAEQAADGQIDRKTIMGENLDIRQAESCTNIGKVKITLRDA